MDILHLPVRLIQGSQNKLFFSDYSGIPEITRGNLNWKRLSKEMFNQMVTGNFGDVDVLYIFNVGAFKLAGNVVLILTKGCSEFYRDWKQFPGNEVVEVNEYINPEGKVIQPLYEPEINNVLRYIFSIKPSLVIISFLNSMKNNIHEKNFKNLLLVPGYQCCISSETINKIKNE